MPLPDNHQNAGGYQQKNNRNERVDCPNPAFRQIEAAEKGERAQTNKKSGDKRIKKIFRRNRRQTDDERHTFFDRDRFCRAANQDAERNQTAQGFADNNGGQRVAHVEFIRFGRAERPGDGANRHSQKIKKLNKKKTAETDFDDARDNIRYADRINKITEQQRAQNRENGGEDFQAI